MIGVFPDLIWSIVLNELHLIEMFQLKGVCRYFYNKYEELRIERKSEKIDLNTIDYYDLLYDIFDNLEQLENKTQGRRKYYFNGEYDSNQTKYENLSNNLNIAILAKNKTVALCLHSFFFQTVLDH